MILHYTHSMCVRQASTPLVHCTGIWYGYAIPPYQL